MAAGDIDPSFSFFTEEAATFDQPWEVGGALQDAQDDYGTRAGTTIDEKIRRRLTIIGKKGNKRQHFKQQSKAQADESDEGLHESSSDSEDRPLPGEADSEVEVESSEVATSEDEDEGEVSEENAEEDADAVATGSDTDEMESDHLDDAAVESEEWQSPGSTTGRGSNETSVSGSKGRDGVDASRQNRKRLRHASDGDESDSEGEDSQGEAGRDKRRRELATGEHHKGKGKGKTNGSFFAATPEGTRFSATSFTDLNLSRPLLKACTALGYTLPTPIQAACIPLALTGRDICGSAMTGSGKTAAFSLPCLERLLHRDRRVPAIYVLILTPTRELAVQVHSMVSKLAQFTDVRAALVVGGLSLQAQAATLRSQPEIVVATPGRFIDHVTNTQSVGLEDLQVLILDEADRLLEMGFADEIREIVRQSPVKRQSMLFSATLTDEVKKLAALSLRTPVRLAADSTCRAPSELTQEIVRLKGGHAANKEAVLLALCSRSFSGGRTIVFFKTKQRAHRAKIVFGLGGLAASGELHGDMTQASRLESLERFRKGELAFLLCTDVAARGLDILGVETVVNYDAPPTLITYLHRVGRTARAGSRGLAVTIVEDDDRQLLKEVVKKGCVALKNRIVPAPAVMMWRDRLEGMEGDVARIREEERDERMLRKAEMEAQKAENMMTHEAEIFSRPARTWFQTPKQKKAAVDKARLEVMGKPPPGEGGGVDTDQGKKKKGKDKEKNKEKGKKKEEDARDKSHKLVEETQEFSRSVRAAKAIEQKLRQDGMLPKAARKLALARVSDVKKPAKKKKKSARAGGGEGLFDGDGASSAGAAGGSSHVYAGGARSGKLKVPRPGVSKTELNRLKRHRRGKHSFKSKAKHKRRK